MVFIRFLMKAFFAVFVFCLTVAWSSPPDAFAIGISPATIIVENILSGATVDSEVNFSRANPARDEDAVIKIEGEAARYIEATQGTKVVLPKGENITRYPFKIHAKNLAAGTYEATITVAPLPPEPEKGFSGTRILSGALARVQFTVTNSEREQFEVKGIEIYEFEEEDPFALRFSVHNTGNVDARFKSVEVAIRDLFDPNFSLQKVITSEKIGIVPAFSEQQITINVDDIKVPKGKYEFTVIAYNTAGEKVAEKIIPLLQVLPRGTLAQAGVFKAFTTDKGKYEIGEIVKFSGKFENTGSIGVTVNMEIEIFQGDKRIEVLKGKSAFVAIQQSTDLSEDFRISESANYTVKAHVNYGLTKTETLETRFSVPSLPMVWIIGSIALVIAVIFGVGVFLRRRHRS